MSRPLGAMPHTRFRTFLGVVPARDSLINQQRFRDFFLSSRSSEIAGMVDVFLHQLLSGVFPVLHQSGGAPEISTDNGDTLQALASCRYI